MFVAVLAYGVDDPANGIFRVEGVALTSAFTADEWSKDDPVGPGHYVRNGEYPLLELYDQFRVAVLSRVRERSAEPPRRN